MKPVNTYLKIALLLLFLGVSFNGTRAQRTAANRWAACYDQPTNKLFFQMQMRQLIKGERCSSRTHFKMKTGWKLIENEWKENGYGGLKAGTKKTLLLPNGRRLMVAQWKKTGQANIITVLEPQLNRQKVRKHCQVTNAKDPFSVRFDSKTRKVKVLATQNDGKLAWKSCKI